MQGQQAGIDEKEFAAGITPVGISTDRKLQGVRDCGAGLGDDGEPTSGSKVDSRSASSRRSSKSRGGTRRVHCSCPDSRRA